MLQDIENRALYQINKKLPFFYRYVDNIIIAASRQQIDNISKIFNSFDDRLQLIVEFENNRCVSFLDLSIHVINGSLKID